MTHILVIDDDVLICNVLRHTLEKSGYRVTAAHNGRKALAAHKAAPADLVITDMIMPDMEGIETIMEFKRSSPAMKIIAMSGGGMGKGGDYLSIAKKFGVHRILPKPFTMQNLTAAVTEVLAECPSG